MASKSTSYYKSHANALKIKQAYQRKYNKKPSQVKKRTELNAENRKRGTYGNGDKLDVSHKQGGGTKLEGQSKNRARNRGKA
tara:strand:+ start:72 stop:317 length:246 start_codon:yes stop_codon:yes gene_type:complete